MLFPLLQRYTICCVLMPFASKFLQIKLHEDEKTFYSVLSVTLHLFMLCFFLLVQEDVDSTLIWWRRTPQPALLNMFLCCTWKGIIRIYFILKRNWAEETYESDNIFSRPEFVCFLLQARRSSVRGGCWLLWCCPCLLLQVQPVQLLMLRDYWL